MQYYNLVLALCFIYQQSTFHSFCFQEPALAMKKRQSTLDIKQLLDFALA